MSRALHPFDPNRNGPLPLQQQRVMDFIRTALSAGRAFPTAREIADHMGWKTEGSALDCLCRLAWRGKVRRTVAPGRKLNAAQRYVWELTHTAGTMTAPTIQQVQR